MCLCSFKKKKNLSSSGPLQIKAFVASPEVMAPWFEFFCLFVYLFFTGHICAQLVIGLKEPEGAGDKVVYFRFLQW